MIHIFMVRRMNLELYKASDVMMAPVCTIQQVNQLFFSFKKVFERIIRVTKSKKNVFVVVPNIMKT